MAGLGSGPRPPDTYRRPRRPASEGRYLQQRSTTPREGREQGGKNEVFQVTGVGHRDWKWRKKGEGKAGNVGKVGSRVDERILLAAVSSANWGLPRASGNGYRKPVFYFYKLQPLWFEGVGPVVEELS